MGWGGTVKLKGEFGTACEPTVVLQARGWALSTSWPSLIDEGGGGPGVYSQPVASLYAGPWGGSDVIAGGVV